MLSQASRIARRLLKPHAKTCSSVAHSFNRSDGRGPLVVHLPDEIRGKILKQVRYNQRTLAGVVPGGGAADGTGFSVWPACEHLCSHLIDTADDLPEPPYVELGGGLGLVSIVLAKLLAERGAVERSAKGGPSPVPYVYCTDGDPTALSLVENAARANGVGDVVRVAALEWGHAAHIAHLRAQLGGKPPGLVVGTDILYNVANIPALVATIAALKPSLAFLAFPPRHASTTEFLTSMYLAATGGHHSPAFAQGRELEALISEAAAHGLQIGRRWRHGDQLWQAHQLVVSLTRMD